MRKFLAIAAIALALGGCADLRALGPALTIGTASIDNPITPAREAQIEAAIDVAIRAMVTYRRACLAGKADVNCRQNIRLAQPYTREVKVLVAQLRRFSDENDQVNAMAVFRQIVPLYESMKSIAGAAGVNIGSLP